MAESDQSPHINRRKFLNRSLAGYTGLGLSQGLSFSLISSLSCTAEGSGVNTAHGACYHDCPDTCSWSVTAKDGKITQFGASKTNPYTNGSLCSKMENFPMDVTFHPDRLLTPLKRTGKKGEGSFAPVSWEEAIADVATKLNSIIDEHGATSVLPYVYAGTEGLVQRNALGSRFFAKLGTSRFNGTICGDAAVAGVLPVYGQTTGVLPEDIVQSRYIVFWGTNPVYSNQHLWRLAKKARENGAKIIVVDPFRSATAELADQHIQPKPGTDVILALSMMQVIISENLHDEEFISSQTTGFEELRNHVQQYPPEVAAELTGLEAQEIIEFARAYAAGDPSLIRFLIGMEHQLNGSNAFRAVSMLPALTGAWKKRGGGFMHMTYELFGEALNWESLSTADQIQDTSIRQINMVQIGRALLDDQDPIKALIVYNTNPAVIAPDQNAVMKGLEREDLFTVVLEHFMTDTARYADYIFPATTNLEHWDLFTSWGQNYITINEPVIPPLGESKPNNEFFRLLATAMGHEDDYLFETDMDILRRTLDSEHPYMEGITFKSLRKQGWGRLKTPEVMMPVAEGQYKTPSGKIEFYSKSLQEAGYSPLPVYQGLARTDEEVARYPLQVLTIKNTKNFLNTSHANVTHLRDKEGKPKLDIHPDDAAERQITDGEEVEVYNAKGRVILTAKVTQRVKPGVVCMPQGFWPSLMKGGRSANALTSDQLTDMGEGAALQDTFGEVRAVS